MGILIIREKEAKAYLKKYRLAIVYIKEWGKSEILSPSPQALTTNDKYVKICCCSRNRRETILFFSYTKIVEIV